MSGGIDIAFAEECESFNLTSPKFPSKIGGKPAWLSLTNLPTCETLECPTCSKQLIFLCQFYAPYDDDDNNFHRTLFIFICRNSTCSKRNSSENILVLRSSLPRVNCFYDYEPPDLDNKIDFHYKTFGIKTCCCCGCLATKFCSKCKTSAYCTKEHQVHDWKQHKKTCGQSEEDYSTSTLLFPEFELVIEPEETSKAAVDENEQLEQLERLRISGEAGTMMEATEEDLQAACITEDKQFSRFQKRIAADKDQVVRYHRGGEPLYIAGDPKPGKVPNCEYCGEERWFECQIMPQMLSVLNENVIDFGIITVYSCKNSCVEIDCYKKEVAFRQDVSDRNL